MPPFGLLLAMVAAPTLPVSDAATYSAALQQKIALLIAATCLATPCPASATPRDVRMELTVDAAGGVQILRLSKSSGDNGVDDAARVTLVLAEPFGAPPGSLLFGRDNLARCAVRMTQSGTETWAVAVECSGTTTPFAAKPLGEAECVRPPNEIDDYVLASFPKLSDCLEAERVRAPHAELPQRLPVVFVVDGNGLVHDVNLKHRSFREGAMAQCVAAALQGSLPPSNGAACPAAFDLTVR